MLIGPSKVRATSGATILGFWSQRTAWDQQSNLGKLVINLGPSEVRATSGANLGMPLV